jgi:hypothetical protein
MRSPNVEVVVLPGADQVVAAQWWSTGKRGSRQNVQAAGGRVYPMVGSSWQRPALHLLVGFAGVPNEQAAMKASP